MKNNDDIENFFKPLKLEHPVSESDYLNVQSKIESLSTLAHIANLGLYVVDYQKKGFLYVSSNPLFLCGYEQEEVKEMGYYFYTKVIPPDELSMLFEISEQGFKYFYKQVSETRKNMFISYDCTMRHKSGEKYKVNHKLTPFALTNDADMWLSLCYVSHSIMEESGNVYIQHFNSPNKSEYSFKTKRWKTVPVIAFTDREKEILRLCAQGYTEHDIANKLFVAKSTVKFHKSNVFEKLDANNIMEAVYFATVNHLI